MYVQKGVQIFLYYNVVTCYNFSFRFRVFVEINFSKKKIDIRIKTYVK